MRSSATVSRAFGAALVLTLGAPALARGDRLPTLATDGVYVGTRVNPGFALSAAWDLDVYLTRNRTLSLGPAVSVSLLGTDVEGGRQQDVLLAADLVRLKLGPFVGDGAVRPYLSLGAGFVYTRLRDVTVAGVEVTPPGATTPVRGTQHFPALEEFAPMVSVGAGGDWFMSSSLGLSAQFIAHFHPSGTPRVPEAWFEIQLGVRFGL